MARNEALVEIQRQKIASYDSNKFTVRAIFDEYVSPDPRNQPQKFANVVDIRNFIHY